MLDLPTVGIDNHYQAAALAHGNAYTALEPFGVFAANLEFVYDHLNVVNLIAIGLHALHNLFYLAVYPHVEITLAPKRLKEFAVVALAVFDQRGEDEDAAIVIIFENQL